MSSPVWLVQPRVVSWPRTSILLLLLLSSITFALQPTAAQAQSNTCNSYPSPHQRMGVNVTLDGGVALSNYDAARLSAGWYHDYNRQLTPSHPNGMQYHQMIRSGINTATLAQTIGPQVDANPGSNIVMPIQVRAPVFFALDFSQGLPVNADDALMLEELNTMPMDERFENIQQALACVHC